MKRFMLALERRSLHTKLLIGLIVAMAVTVAIGIHALVVQHRMSQEVRQRYEMDTLGMSIIQAARLEFAELGPGVRMSILASSPLERDLAIKQLRDHEAALKQSMEHARQQLSLKEAGDQLKKFDQNHAIYQRHIDQAIGLALLGRVKEAQSYVSSADFQEPGAAAYANLSELARIKEAAARVSVIGVGELVVDAQWTTAILLVVGALLGIGSGLLATASLRRSSEKIRRAEARRGIKTHIADISSELLQATSLTDLSSAFFTGLAPLIKLGHGALFIHEEDQQRLRLLGGHALGESEGNVQYLHLGQGIAGQCAVARRPVQMSELPENDESTNARPCADVPCTIVALPVLRKERLLGVLELATFEGLGENGQALLDGTMPILAMSLEIVDRNDKAQQLLEETRRQAIDMENQARRLEEQAAEMAVQQTEIRAAEERSRLILGSVKDGIVGLDNDGAITFANPAAYDMLGYSEEEFIGLCLHDLVHHTYPDGQHFPHEACPMYLTSQDGSPRTVDSEVLWLKDGTPIPVEYSTTPVYLQGSLAGTVSVYRDITDRKAAQEALKHVNFLNDQALGLTKAGYYHVPLDGSGWYNSSKRTAAIFGNIACENYRYRTAEDWFDHVKAADPVLAKASLKSYRDAIDGKAKAFDAIYPYKRPVDGQVVWVHSYGTVSRDAEGKPTDMYGVSQDVTEYIQAQQELAKAKELAEEATRSKSDFLANMSHEIRTPMNAIIGMSHLALQTNLDKRQRSHIEKVHRAGENLLGIINDILDFSKIEAGKMSIEGVDFRLEDVLDHLSSLLGLKAGDKGLELLFNLAPNLCTTLVGDPLRLGQVLINLCNNAVKFTEKGEIIVGVEMVGLAGDGSDQEVELHFWVRDSGIGMSPEQCSKLFQSFSQGDASTTRKYGGTGLGLAISKNLVELMKGRIWVESEAGQGSTFHFQVRFGVQTQPMPRRVLSKDVLRGLRLLVVDDNASAREILSTMAHGLGMEVDAAWNGQQALLLLNEAEKRSRPYDLVLMDWKMPVMDGVETIQRLKSNALLKTATVVMVTAYGREEAISDAQERGVELRSVLTKPVTESALFEALGEALGLGVIFAKPARNPANGDGLAMAKLRGARVLLAEDNEMNQELAMELLAQAGMEIVLARNGQEAVDILSGDNRFDGVLMDCQMPVMDGYTATRVIHQMPEFLNLPIIAMTANAMARDKEKAMEAGMCDHIAKPLDVGEMFHTIAKWIKPGVSARVQESDMTTTPICATGVVAEVTGGLPPLPGIDVRAGLATCAGKQSLYVRLLIKFRDGQGNFADLFDAAKLDGDREAATRTAHTLKGTAGNIGAKAVQAVAGKLERACQESQPQAVIEALLKEVLAEMAIVMSGLKEVSVGAQSAGDGTSGSAPTAKPETLPMPEAQITDYIDRLKLLLEDSDSRAEDLLCELTEKLGGSSLTLALKPVAEAIEDFEFHQALVRLQEAALTRH